MYFTDMLCFPCSSLPLLLCLSATARASYRALLPVGLKSGSPVGRQCDMPNVPSLNHPLPPERFAIYSWERKCPGGYLGSG